MSQRILGARRIVIRECSFQIQLQKGYLVEKKRYQYLLFALIGLAPISVKAQEAKYPPLSEYMMDRDA